MLLTTLLQEVLSFIFIFLASSGVLAAYDKPLCVSPNNMFHAQVNIFAGELGYYVFEECGLDVINPTLAMELGETYTFVQVHRTNHFHPIGFAYSPYGDEELKKEVDPATSHGNQDCTSNKTCDAPMYFLNNEYLGQYSNNPTVKAITTNVTDLGLEVYDSFFRRNIHEWAQFGTFSIQFTITDPELATDMFIYCHIHEWMAGRIKVTKNGNVINELDVPTLGFEYDYNTPLMSDFDRECGTFGLEPFQTPGNPHCPNYFVCDKDDPSVSPEMAKFSTCIDAMNCHMLGGMTTGIKAHDERALFIHQMIPHHQVSILGSHIFSPKEHQHAPTSSLIMLIPLECREHGKSIAQGRKDKL